MKGEADRIRGCQLAVLFLRSHTAQGQRPLISGAEPLTVLPGLGKMSTQEA